jgi:hypothetical protein
MKCKKAQTSTDTPIILSILVFQAFIIICLGFLNINNNEITTTTHENTLWGFSITNIITNISILGWGNLLIFVPIEICIIYIIAKLFRGGG